MNISAKRVGISRVIVVVTLALAGAVSLAARLWAEEEQPKSETRTAQLAKDMIGAWVLVGTPDAEGELPATGGRLKFFTGKHWTITEADESGKVVFHHGGTYTLQGEDYEETVKYANESTADLIGQTFKFKIKVEDDKYTQVGIGNPFSEVWKRAK